MATLYLVGTPIGNLEDITLRALRILREAPLIAAEDTRTTGVLLRHFNIETRMVSFHEHNERERIPELLEWLTTADLALVSDAGMPGLSDPGYRLVQAAVTAGHTITPIPGPSAAITALVSSGLPTDQFLFLGFLPRQAQARRAALADVAGLPYTLVLYEAPHRLLGLLADIQAALGERQICVGRELTKLYEELWRGVAAEALEYFGRTERIRGEITIVVGGAGPTSTVWTEAQVRARLAQLLAEDVALSQAAAQVAAEAGWRRRAVYSLAHPR